MCALLFSFLGCFVQSSTLAEICKLKLEICCFLLGSAELIHHLTTMIQLLYEFFGSCYEDEIVEQGVLIVVLIVFGSGVIVNIIMFRGITKKSCNLLKPWLAWNVGIFIYISLNAISKLDIDMKIPNLVHIVLIVVFSVPVIRLYRKFKKMPEAAIATSQDSLVLDDEAVDSAA